MAQIDVVVAELARLRAGIAVREELILAGVTDEMIRERVAAGMWQRLQAGVYLVGAAAPSWHQRLLGATLCAPGFVFGARRAAGYLHGFDGASPGPLEVVTDMHHRVRPRGVLVHHTVELRAELR